MRKLALATIVASAAAGCMGGGQQARVEAEITVAERECDEKFTTGRIRTRVAYAHCFNDAQNRIAGPYMGEHRDVYAVIQATRLALAEKLDRNQITRAEADLELARVKSQAASEIGRREAAESAAVAQQVAAGAALKNSVQASVNSWSRPPVRCTSVRTGTFTDTNCY